MTSNMKLHIVHKTKYTYSENVFIQPHYLRFMPRETPLNKLESFHLTISPAPMGLSYLNDSENNHEHFCWFSGNYRKLSIQAESVVIVQESNPLSFLMSPNYYLDLPFIYDPFLRGTLHATLIDGKIDSPLIKYGNHILAESSYETISFIINLTSQIYTDFELEFRLEGEPLTADKTYDLKKGSCRDLSWMQIQLLRHQGIAARFVSGYYFMEVDNPQFELHSWVEVYLPGGGWVGFDPSHGIMTGSSHIPICSSSHYQNTMPVSGSFRGTATSRLETSLSINRI